MAVHQNFCDKLTLCYSNMEMESPQETCLTMIFSYVGKSLQKMWEHPAQNRVLNGFDRNIIFTCGNFPVFDEQNAMITRFFQAYMTMHGSIGTSQHQVHWSGWIIRDHQGKESHPIPATGGYRFSSSEWIPRDPIPGISKRAKPCRSDCATNVSRSVLPAAIFDRTCGNGRGEKPTLLRQGDCAK